MKRIGMAVAPFLVLGCVAQDDARLKKVAEIDSLKDSVASLEREVKALESSGLALQEQVEEHNSAIFDPASSRGYHRLDTTTGMFLLSIQSVAPYLDGYRVTCNFGNPSSATFKGFKLRAKWGPRSPMRQNDHKMTYSQWQAALQEKELSLTETLRAGWWNPVSFVLSPAKPDEFGYLELSMETGEVSLLK